MLEKAGMTTADLVKVTTSLTDAKDIPAYAKVRGEILGDIRPAFMLQVVTQLIKPEVLVEVEVIAASSNGHCRPVPSLTAIPMGERVAEFPTAWSVDTTWSCARAHSAPQCVGFWP
jgi:Endoribonuclease L-PSP